MKKISIIVLMLLILTNSCSNQQYKLNNYINYPIKFAKQEIKYPNGDFSLSIPLNWEWKVETYGNEKIILGIDAGSKTNMDGFIDILSVQKLKSFGEKTDLKSEFDYYLELQQTNWNGEVIETGETEIFGEKAYFLHTKSNTRTYGETESINFILNSKTRGVFYNLTASASQTDELKKNMAILIQCLRTFKKKNSE